MILQEIEIAKSYTQMQIKNISATAEAMSYNIRQNAMAKTTELVIDSEAEGYTRTQELTGLPEENLNEYIYYLSLLDKTDKKLVIGSKSLIADTRNSYNH